MTDEKSVFDQLEEEEFKPPSTAKELSPARQASIQKMQEGRRLALERKRRESSVKVNRNQGDQRTHDTAHEAVHDENTEQLTGDMHRGAEDLETEVTEWVRPSDLDAPPPRRGFVNRWIRIRLGETRDNAHLMKKMREGWRPVKASSAEVQGYSLPNTSHSILGEGDYIGNDNLLLMEMPAKVDDQRTAFYKGKQKRLTGAIDRQAGGVHSQNDIGFGAIKAQNRSRTVYPGQSRNAAPAGDDVDDI